jgi:hypothetical protein
MGTRESPKVDDVIAGAAQLVANKFEVRHVSEKAGSHFGDASPPLPGLATIDDDPPILRVELCDSFRRSGVPGGSIRFRDSLGLVMIDHRRTLISVTRCAITHMTIQLWR